MANWSQFALFAGLTVAWPLIANAQGEAAPIEAPRPDERVILEADSVYEIREDNSVVAEGNVEAIYRGRVLKADKVIYNRTTERVRAIGNVIIIDIEGNQQFADEADVGSDLADGYVIGFSARLPDGATVAANSGIRRADGINALDQVIYSSCEVCPENPRPTWAIRARRAVLDQQDQMISYRDAVFEIAGIPVFYLPYLAHPDPGSDRRSGFLIPNAGLSSKLGAFYKQPYYWAVSDYSDITIAPLVSENVNPLLGLDFRKRFYSGAVKFETSVTEEQEFDSDGDRFGKRRVRGHVYGNGAFAISPEWIWGFGVEHQTDDLYDRRYDIGGQADRRGLYASQPRRLLSQLYAVGQNKRSYTDIALLGFQGLRGADDSSRLPLVTPLAFSERYWDLGSLGFATVNASSAVLTRETGADSGRVSAGAEWRNVNLLPGGLVFEPFVEARGDFYALDKAVSGKDTVSRLVGNAGAALAFPMVRTGKVVDIYLEPKVMGAWGLSNANDPAIPNEDAKLFEFDETRLFDANGASGFDLFEGDAKFSAGLSARAVWKNGTELSGTIGRRWRARRDPAFDALSNLGGTTSDWLASASVSLGSALRLDSRVRLDEDDLNLNRIDLRFSSRYKRFSAVGQYYKINERISPAAATDEGVFVRGEFEVTDRFALIYGQLRDIADNLDAQQEIGIAYFDDCSRFELVYSRSELIDRTLGPTENLQFRFTLRSLGDFGSSSFD